jgi:hypothetical protein
MHLSGEGWLEITDPLLACSRAFVIEALRLSDRSSRPRVVHLTVSSLAGTA